MATIKNERIYVRVNDEIKADFETVAAFRGLKTSALLHSLIVRTIHEQRELTPQIFVGTVAEKTSEESNNIQNARQSKKNFIDEQFIDKSNSSAKILIGDSEIPLIDEAEFTLDEGEGT